MRPTALTLYALLLLSFAAAPVPGRPAADLLGRDRLGAPQRWGGAVSPDGAWLAYVAMDGGTPNVFLAPRAAPSDGVAVTHDRGRGIRSFWFAYDGRHLLYTQDSDGDENDRLYALDLRTRAVRALTPPGARAIVDTLSPQTTGEVLVLLNDRDPKYFDPVRIELASGRVRRLFENSRYAAFVADRRLDVRLATFYPDDGTKRWFRRRGGDWEPWIAAPAEDALTSTILGFDVDGRTVYMADSRGRDTAAIRAVTVDAPGSPREIVSDARVDLGVVLVHPRSGRVQAVLVDDLRGEWRAVDPAVAIDLRALARLARGQPFFVDSRSLDDTLWIVRVAPSDATARTYLYERGRRRATPWFEANPDWVGLALQRLHAVEFPSRDGLRLTAYFMLPRGSDPDGDGRPASPVPTVLWVHGGPWDRESYRANPLFQLYADRGYAVLAVNFRGSTGFGKRFVNAANGEWGGRMQDDLLDAKAWAVREGIARPDRVAIVGGSYGGYAALAGLAFTPDEFACGISVAGPSNLLTLMNSIPDYWAATRTLYATRVGDPGTPDGRELLERRSPLRAAGRIRSALLIGQGANDPRVTVAEAEQMVAALRANAVPVTYVLFPDEGHGFQREANDEAFSAVTEEFLARCLGGRFQPVGTDFAHSSITVPVGIQYLPEVAAALRAR